MKTDLLAEFKIRNEAAAPAKQASPKEAIRALTQAARSKAGGR
jgi:hypothetical protein